MGGKPGSIEQKARIKLTHAIQQCQIRRPERCERCDNPKPEGHHTDYNRPLYVIWLCRPCHMLEHVNMRKQEMTLEQMDAIDYALHRHDVPPYRPPWLFPEVQA